MWMLTKVQHTSASVLQAVVMPVFWPVPACARACVGDYVLVPWGLMSGGIAWLFFGGDDAPSGLAPALISRSAFWRSAGGGLGSPVEPPR
eukprot:9584145-Alexandrium_andersonii.AAC.1